MQTSVESYTNHESMMLLCVKQPNALEDLQKLMVQSLKEAVSRSSVSQILLQMLHLCARLQPQQLLLASLEQPTIAAAQQRQPCCPQISSARSVQYAHSSTKCPALTS